MLIKPNQHRPTLTRSTKLIEPHGIKPLEYFFILAMARQATMLLIEALNILEARNNSFLARSAASRLTCLDLNAQFGEQGIVVFGEGCLRHFWFLLSCGIERQYLRPFSFPMDQVM